MGIWGPCVVSDCVIAYYDGIWGACVLSDWVRNPHWPHRQGACRACGRLQGRFLVELRLHRFILCTMRSGDTAHEDGGCDQSIGSTDSDAIVPSWLWSTATRSSPLGYFSRLLQVVENDPTFCDSRFCTGRLLAVEDFTFFSHHKIEFEGPALFLTEPSQIMKKFEGPALFWLNHRRLWGNSRVLRCFWLSHRRLWGNSRALRCFDWTIPDYEEIRGPCVVSEPSQIMREFEGPALFLTTVAYFEGIRGPCVVSDWTVAYYDWNSRALRCFWLETREPQSWVFQFFSILKC